MNLYLLPGPVIKQKPIGQQNPFHWDFWSQTRKQDRKELGGGSKQLLGQMVLETGHERNQDK